MIRRDYILRMLQEFCEVLSRMRALQKGQKWAEAITVADEQFQKLVGAGAETVAQLSETELLAKVIRGEATQAVREKTLILATLLKEAADLEFEQGHAEQSRVYYLKGLHLLLGVLAREDAFECPEFVPRVDQFTACLADSSLPLSTQAMLMQHYERIGEFGKAEDALFSMMEAQPQNPDLLDFGIEFYHRLERQTETALSAGNLPLAELTAGLQQLVAAKKGERSTRFKTSANSL